MKKTISIILSAVFILCAFPFALAKEDSAVYLKGDADKNGAVTIEDARAVMRFAIRLDAPPAPGSGDFKRLKCTSSRPGELTMEDARMVLRAAIKLPGYTDCYTKSELTELFNTLANRVKDPMFASSTKMTEINSASVSSQVLSYDFGEFDSLIKNMLDGDDSLNSPETTVYDPPLTNRTIYSFTYPIRGSQTVSELKPADIKNITISMYETADVLAAFPGRINSSDITAYKSVKCGNTVRIHIELKDEKYSQVRSKGDDYQPVLSRIGTFSFNDITAGYEMTDISSDGLFNYRIETICRDLTAGGDIDYYFNADLLPVAAVYSISQAADIACLMDISAEENGQVVPFVNGSINQLCKATEDTVFLFNSYFVNN